MIEIELIWSTGRRTPVQVELFEDQGEPFGFEGVIGARGVPELGPLQLLGRMELVAAFAGWARLLHDNDAEQVERTEGERRSPETDEADLEQSPWAEKILRVRCALSRAPRVLVLLDPTNSGKRPIEVRVEDA